MRRKKHYFERLAEDPEPIVHSMRRRLRFSEVDALAIAWHGRYLQFFEEVHTELMRKVGLTYDRYRAVDVGAPMVQSHVDYFAPLELDELFTIEASLVWNEGARLNVEYLLTRENGVTAASGYTVQMFFNVRTHEPYLIAPEIFEECRGKWREGCFE